MLGEMQGNHAMRGERCLKENETFLWSVTWSLFPMMLQLEPLSVGLNSYRGFCHLQTFTVLILIKAHNYHCRAAVFYLHPKHLHMNNKRHFPAICAVHCVLLRRTGTISTGRMSYFYLYLSSFILSFILYLNLYLLIKWLWMNYLITQNMIMMTFW